MLELWATSANAAWDHPLREGLEREGKAGIATLSDPTLADGLARFAAGERPESPRPG